MKRKQLSLYSFLFVFIILGIGYFTIMPRWTSDSETPLEEFSSERAFNQIKKISAQQQLDQLKNHETTKLLLQTELQKLGIEVTLESGTILTERRILTQSQNILARIKGTKSQKALLLLSHYDNAPNSSFGASNSGIGIASILETVRAFLYNKNAHANDIIILFTDSKETGLNGATLFATQHQWAKEIGLAINLDAHGTDGPVYMNIQTKQGNASLVNEFDNAGVTYPAGNSLMGTLFKKIALETDATILRKKRNIQGISLTLLDNNYNNQTPQDNLQNLNLNVIAHHGAYLLPLLNYFSNANLNDTNTITDDVYFTIPFGFIHYSYDLINTMLYLAIGLFLILLLIGVAKRILNIPMILRGIVPLFGSFTFSVFTAYFGWKMLLLNYPQYNDFINGFTYNGHDYIAAFGFLTLAICFIFYNLFPVKKSVANNYVSPIILGLITNIIITHYDNGGAFLIIPIYCSLVIFATIIITQRSNRWLNLIMSIPALLLITPFITLLPIVWGLKFLFASSAVIVILVGLIVPVFENWNKKGLWAFGFFIISIGFFIKASCNANPQTGKAKPNSLVYLYDIDTHQANWLTYDKNLDDWTKKYLGQEPNEITSDNELYLFSPYNSRFTFSKKTTIRPVKPATIAFLKDSLTENKRFLTIKIIPNRMVNRYDVFANENMEFIYFKANGVASLENKTNQTNRKEKNILRYFVRNNEPLIMDFCIKRATVFDMQLLESSFDLLQNPLFGIEARTSTMIPMPYVLNNAICIKQTIKPTLIVPELPVTAVPALTPAVIFKTKKVIKPVLAVPKPVVAPVVHDSL